MNPEYKPSEKCSDLRAACKRTQQLPTLLRQQCWELLRACWQWCANGRNNSQQCCANNVGSCSVRVGSGVQTDATQSQQCRDLQCIVGRIQPISLCKPCVMRVRGPKQCWKSCANGSNVVALRFGYHGTKEMLGVVG